jgi:hypothetical protein
MDQASRDSFSSLVGQDDFFFPAHAYSPLESVYYNTPLVARTPASSHEISPGGLDNVNDEFALPAIDSPSQPSNPALTDAASVQPAAQRDPAATGTSAQLADNLSRPARKRKAPTRRECDFAPYKDRITKLHLEDGLTLGEISTKFREEAGFEATFVPTRS